MTCAAFPAPAGSCRLRLPSPKHLDRSNEQIAREDKADHIVAGILAIANLTGLTRAKARCRPEAGHIRGARKIVDSHTVHLREYRTGMTPLVRS
jgi:hypothetical protein